MSGRNIFLSYASGSFVAARDALCSSALRVNFDEARARGPSDLDRAFVQINQNILSQPRGGGYWLWKPQIILQELQTLASNELSNPFLVRNRWSHDYAALSPVTGRFYCTGLRLGDECVDELIIEEQIIAIDQQLIGFLGDLGQGVHL